MFATIKEMVHRHEGASIGEQTNVRVKLGTAWGVISAIIGTTVWLTFVAVKIHLQNQHEHEKLITGMTQLQVKSGDWVTRAQIEDTLVYLLKESHRGMTNFSRREAAIREGVHDHLSAPKYP